MKVTKILFLIACLLTAQAVFSQDLQLTKKDSIVQNAWIFGLGFNAVDDAGTEFEDVFNFEDNWNAVPFPSRLSIGRYFANGLGLELIGTYNQYKTGKVIDGSINQEDINYYAADFRVSYDLNQILGETGFFDPYVGIGAGYTDANNRGRGTYNATVGFRTWFSDRFGLDINSTGKWAMQVEEGVTNHLQHSLGAVYRFGIEKGLSKKGEEKLARIQEIEKEQQRIQDSIAEAQRAEEEAKRLAEELERQREAERLAAAEREKQNSEQAERKALQDKIDSLGNVRFALNSSYLDTKDKELLDNLIGILEEVPGIKIRVASHTDSRGTEKYNQWLSERRVNRTVEYIISKGISEDRILKEAFGETKLANDCEDRVPCSEEKHAENRRSEFSITDY